MTGHVPAPVDPPNPDMEFGYIQLSARTLLSYSRPDLEHFLGLELDALLEDMHGYLKEKYGPDYLTIFGVKQ